MFFNRALRDAHLFGNLALRIAFNLPKLESFATLLGQFVHRLRELGQFLATGRLGLRRGHIGNRPQGVEIIDGPDRYHPRPPQLA